MDDRRPRPVLYLDFDNTITQGDVLDRIIERFSVSDDWRDAEEQWRTGMITTAQCLTRQVGGLRVTPPELERFSAGATLDPAFGRLVTSAREARVDLVIVSDNFRPVIDAILRSHALHGLDVRANELEFSGDRAHARFPWRDPRCGRCAHCKAVHLRDSSRRPRVFAGDGLSDICPALVADVVFAKDALAQALERRGVAYRPFASLADVLAFIEPRPSTASVR